VNLYQHEAWWISLIKAALNTTSPFGTYETRHLFNALVGITGLVGTWKLGRSLGGPRAGFLAALFLSTTTWDVAGSWEEVGFRNYQKMFGGGDELFTAAVKNTLYFVLFNVPGVQIIALALAALLNQQLRGIAIFRTIFYLPAVTSGIATAYLWATILAKFGLLNGMLALIGVDGPTWLYSLEWSMPAIIMYLYDASDTLHSIARSTSDRAENCG